MGGPSRLCYLVKFQRKTAVNDIVEAYRSCNGNAVHAAKKLGVSHATLLRFVRILDISSKIQDIRKQCRQNMLACRAVKIG